MSQNFFPTFGEPTCSLAKGKPQEADALDVLAVSPLGLVHRPGLTRRQHEVHIELKMNPKSNLLCYHAPLAKTSWLWFLPTGHRTIESPCQVGETSESVSKPEAEAMWHLVASGHPA